MNTFALLLIYCAAVAAASLFGGFIPHVVKLTHTRMQTALSFVAGAMLGVGVLHLIPHSFVMTQSVDRTMGFVLLGFLLMFFIERAFHFHHHGTIDEATDGALDGPDHDCDHGHHHHEHRAHSPAPTKDHGPPPEPSKIGWGPALVGLGLHSILDGVALAASVAAERDKHHDLAWAGFAVFLVVVLHKPFDSLTLGTLMAVGERSPRLRHLVNGTYAAAVPLGVLLFQIGALSIGGAVGDGAVGAVLAVAGGAFLCIASSDLLPELQFHTHDRFRLSAALLLGIVLAWGIVFLEEHGHDHGPPSPAPTGSGEKVGR